MTDHMHTVTGAIGSRSTTYIGSEEGCPHCKMNAAMADLKNQLEQTTFNQEAAMQRMMELAEKNRELKEEGLQLIRNVPVKDLSLLLEAFKAVMPLVGEERWGLTGTHMAAAKRVTLWLDGFCA